MKALFSKINLTRRQVINKTGFRKSGGGGGAPARGKRPQKDKFRVNEEIYAQEVRVIDDEGKMLGVYHPLEALRMARDKGLDLIEIAPTANPPTCRIMDYGKWKYENKKKEAQARKNQTVIVIKEVQLRPRTDDHDLLTKLKHARRFLLEGDKVKVNLRFMGREMAHQEVGIGLLEKFTAGLEDLCIIEARPKLEGRQMFAMYAPDPVKVKAYREKHPAANEKSEEDSSEADQTEVDA